jgi:hypothetical protein
MMFINSTVQPSDYSSDHARWNIIDLKPGEVKVIDYLARALQNGVFVNQAHIDTASVDGSDGAFADVSCQVQIGSAFNSGSNSSWQPPTCFGLNCTQQDYGDEWLPCDACGISVNETKTDFCTSCVLSSSGDGGYDILRFTRPIVSTLTCAFLEDEADEDDDRYALE